MSVEYTIICNGCGMVGDASGLSAAHARQELRRDKGWKTNLPGGKDLCGDCKPQPQGGAS